VTGLVGPNGAGKSTLIRMVAGVARPSAGEVEFNGEVIRPGRPLSAYRRKLGYLPQDARWANGWLVRDYVDYVAQAFGVRRGAAPAARRAALEVTDALDYADRRLGSLSGGQAQRVHLATAIVHDPEIVILDEPNAGLDPAERVRVRSFLRGQGVSRTVLVSTHLMDDVAMGTDHVLVMADGQIKWEGSVAEMAAQADGATEGMSRAEAGYLRLVGQ
jgi:ABC-type multidrug transport system ATPase subunit